MADVEIEGFEPHIPEQLAPPVESRPLTPGEQALLAAIDFPDVETRNLHHAFFEMAILKELDTCVDPADRDMLATVASAIEWQWFSSPGDPLPEGVVLSVTDDLAFTDDRTQTSSYHLRRHILKTGVLDSIMGERKHEFNAAHYDEILYAMGEIVKETPLYQVLHALVSEVPVTKDVPLTLAQRIMRETQEEDAVRSMYGLERTDSFRVNPNAHRTYQQRLSQLDDETTRRKEVEITDPKERLVNFMIAGLNERRSEDESEILSLATDDRRTPADDTRVVAHRADGTRDSILSDISDLSDHYADTMNHQDEWLERYEQPSRDLLYRLAVELFEPDNAHMSAMQLLELAAKPYHVMVYNDGRGAIEPTLVAYLYGLDVPIVEHRSTGEIRWKKDSETKVQVEVHSEQACEEQASELLGRVTEGISGTYNHMFMTGMSKPAYPESVDDYDLQIQLDQKKVVRYSATFNQGIAQEVPLVPGFELVARNKSEQSPESYFFKRTEGDPYDGSANVLLGQEYVDSLINQVNKIGYTQLAQELSRKQSPTLADLVSAISLTSDYTFDSSRALPLTGGFTTDNFTGLMDERGRMQVQCTGAATFLRHALMYALPQSRVTLIGGRLIKPGGRIERSKHVQVMVAFEGEQYILDSTPVQRGGMAGSLYGNSNSDSVGQRLWEWQRDKPAQESPISAEEPDPVYDIPLLEVRMTTGEERQQQLETQANTAPLRARQLLKAHFNLPITAPDNELFERTLELKKDADPIRRVLKLVLRHENDKDISAELETELTYLENIETADMRKLKRIGIPRYEANLFAGLKQILQDLQTLA